MGYFRERPKAGKGRDQDDLWRKRHGKIWGKGDRRDQLHINRLLGSILIWSCTRPDGHILSCHPTKLHFSLFSWVRGLCSAFKGVYTG